MPFTDRQVNALRPKIARYEVPEPGRTGLAVRVTSTGIKTWTFRYRFNGEQQRMVFGAYPAMSLADAREALAKAKKHLDTGHDPGAIVADIRHAERTAPTMAAVAQEYLDRHASRTMRPATVREDRRILDREIVPAWRHRRAKQITRRDLIVLLDAIEDRGARVLRNRVAGVLSRVFLFALDRGIVDASPAVNVKRLEEQPRKRFLSQDEIRAFWFGLDTVPITPAIKMALRWALVTGQRRGELAGARRDEIDLMSAPSHRRP
jgi:hypothetical protein